MSGLGVAGTAWQGEGGEEMTLYQITGEYRRLLELLSDPDYTDYIDAVNETLEAKGDEFDIKVESYIKVIQQLKADAEVLRAEENRLYERRVSIQKRIESMKEALQNNMMAAGRTKIRTTLFSVYIQNNPPSLFVHDIESIPGEFLEYHSPSVNKVEIIKEFKKGNAVPGCELRQGMSLRIK